MHAMCEKEECPLSLAFVPFVLLVVHAFPYLPSLAGVSGNGIRLTTDRQVKSRPACGWRGSMVRPKTAASKNVVVHGTPIARKIVGA